MITIDTEKKEEVKKVTFTREVDLGKIGTLRITQNLQKLIDYLHYKVGATEWSGILFYKLVKGDIKDLKNLEFVADFVYPMNIGSSVYTEFDYNSEVIEAYDVYPEGIEMDTALIHSHHSMSTFFSGTDSEEIKDNASHYNYYVSLIVNFAHEYCAKIAFPSKTEVVSKFSVRDNFGKFFTRNSKKEENTILIGNLDIVIENEVEKPEWVEKRIEVLEEKKKKANKVKLSFTSDNQFPQYGRNSRIFNDDFDYPDVQSTFKKDWKHQPEVKGIDYRNKSSNFLSALVNLDPKNINSDLANVLTDLNKMADDEIELYEDSLDSNIKIIHQHIYKDDLNLKKHCLEALLELSSLEVIFGDTEIYNIITNILGQYAL
jgi:hypothetical protein